MPRFPLAVSLLLSGAAALVYQVVWVRQLTTVLGTTLEAVSLVLGLFMLGLGLGAALASRFIDRLPGSRLTHLYAALEIGVGVFAIFFPMRIAAFTSILLLLPTTLMGATLPTAVAILARSGRGADATGRSAGLLYACNTAGAVLGSLMT
ncbi:MAG TPA: spermidine synthase, partial [Vicinamibacteria bacterium]|nr:spermidine synthase [Vicinamibacteria bacterium]